MNQKLIIIKLGGSIITQKDNSIPKIRATAIKQICHEIKLLVGQNKYQLILVHGGGSFGHSLAKKYDLTKGIRNKNSYTKIGIAETALSMKFLNNIVVKSLNQCGIITIGLSPISFITQTNGKLNNFNINIIKDILDLNIIPVLYGDVVTDKKLGCSIVSGDIIVSYLAHKLKADKVIFLSDVDGIFDDDPKKNPQAKLIIKVNNKNLKQVLSGIKSSGRDDVTGEMAGKILSIQKNLKNTEVIIANGLKQGNLLKALGQSPIGTKLRFD